MSNTITIHVKEIVPPEPEPEAGEVVCKVIADALTNGPVIVDFTDLAAVSLRFLRTAIGGLLRHHPREALQAHIAIQADRLQPSVERWCRKIINELTDPDDVDAYLALFSKSETAAFTDSD